MTSLTGLTITQVEALVAGLGEPPYRAAQLLRGLYRDVAPTLDAISTLPAGLRARLVEAGYVVSEAEEVQRQVSADGQTTKLLLQTQPGTLIETVLMQYPGEAGGHPRSTVCVSTQAGCAMGCVFCATGQMGFQRNLDTPEIVAQVLFIARLLRSRDQHVTNIVFMGMGEPLANYGNTIAAVRLLTDPRTFGLGQRHVTISTVGIMSGIEKLANEDLQVGLAISLHAPTDDLRRRLVPTAGHYSVNDLLSAAKRFFQTTGRRVTFEYALLAGINDSAAMAEELARKLRGIGAHVNLIPVNPTAGGFKGPSVATTRRFEQTLRAAGVNCTVRVEKGVEISAACGQLRTEAEGAIPASRRSLITVEDLVASANASASAPAKKPAALPAKPALRPAPVAPARPSRPQVSGGRASAKPPGPPPAPPAPGRSRRQAPPPSGGRSGYAPRPGRPAQRG